MPSQTRSHEWRIGADAIPATPDIATKFNLRPDTRCQIKSVVEAPNGLHLVFLIHGQVHALNAEMWKPAPATKKLIPLRTYCISRDRAHQQIGLFDPYCGDPVPYVHQRA